MDGLSTAKEIQHPTVGDIYKGSGNKTRGQGGRRPRESVDRQSETRCRGSIVRAAEGKKKTLQPAGVDGGVGLKEMKRRRKNRVNWIFKRDVSHFSWT